MSYKNANQLLAKLFLSFRSSLMFPKSEPARKFIKSLGFNHIEFSIGYNSGQFHHRESQEFKQQYESIGVLTKRATPVNKTLQATHRSFGTKGIIFPLIDSSENIVNLFSIRFKQDSRPEAYLNNEGFYPAHPHSLTKRLYITSSIIDAASLLHAKVLDQKQAILSLFNGVLNQQISQCIIDLKFLNEIILINSGVINLKQQFEAFVDNVSIIEVRLPDGLCLNDMLIKNGSEEILNWLNTEIQKHLQTQTISDKLEIYNQNKILFRGKAAIYEIWGNLPMDYGSMKVTLHIVTLQNLQKHRLKIDLYEVKDIENNLIKIETKDKSVNINEIEADLIELTDLLEKHREKLFDEENSNTLYEKISKELTPSAEIQAIEFLKRKNLLSDIDNLLEQSGIVGESQVRLVLFIIASTYKMPYTLHALIQGESGGGKSHIINAIAQCVPQEDVMNFTRITSKSFYHYNLDELLNKLILIQDFDGLDEEARFAFREMQSSGFLCSSITEKDHYGNLKAKVKKVNSHFASLVTTTKAEVYYDNMSRSVILGIDESPSQTDDIILYQNQKQNGVVEELKEEQAKQLLRNCIRVLKSSEVINPYAEKISIPVEAQMKRRLNQQFQNYVAQITILNQYNRKRDNKGRLITTVEDVKYALNTFFSVLWLKIDDLDSSTRQFFERLKKWVYQQASDKNTRFTERDARTALNISKTRMNNYIQILKSFEYIEIAYGSANRGFKYQITFWDNIEKVKSRIQQELTKQFAVNAVNESENGTPETGVSA